MTWVMNLPDQSLCYILADAGYDVKYDFDHDEAFWDFNWHDMARDDLPSMIYYILNQTRQTQIGYVGHFQGTMIGFAEFGSFSNSAQNNVSLYGALAPVAHLAHIKSPLKYLFNTPTNPEEVWHTLFGYKDFLSSSYSIKWLTKHACGNVILNPLIYENILFLISYDYGLSEKNQLHYNQTIPPIYNIRPMTIPTAIFWPRDDWLADPDDVAFIFDNIKNLISGKYIYDYNHLDFVWAIIANKIIYQGLITQMQKYHPEK
ncbi:unnamed protein product [Rotaria socialis]|uniref:Triacylglycerol lipase n=2 Tax=Rotaria socialis TaxID=392032 RepID=A0A818GQ60_9BILA|nr:unnamed protein product [Rotaria socialis]